MNIAILEDDNQDMEHLRQLLKTYAEKKELRMIVETFSISENFLRAFSAGKYDLIFFDNYIGSGLGIDIARKVRLIDKDVDIVFVSMSAEFAISGFEVRALHYLIKPVTIDELEQVFERQRESRSPAPQQEEFIDVMTEHETITIPIDEIRYIEVVDKTCLIHHSGKDTKTYMSLEKLTEYLPGPQFLRTHKSYVVNVAFVKTMGKSSFMMKDGVEVPIGRTHLVSCKREYMKYLAKQ